MAEKKKTAKPKPVVKIAKVTKPLTKPAVKNPTAPKAVGAAAPRGAVRVITKSETAMKKGQAAGVNKKKTTARNPNKYNPSSATNKLIESTQNIKGKGYTPLKPGEKAAANTKGGKPTKGTPKKEAPKKEAPKRRIFGGGLRGGMGGGDMFGGQIK